MVLVNRSLGWIDPINVFMLWKVLKGKVYEFWNPTTLCFEITTRSIICSVSNISVDDSSFMSSTQVKYRNLVRPELSVGNIKQRIWKSESFRSENLVILTSQHILNEGTTGRKHRHSVVVVVCYVDVATLVTRHAVRKLQLTVFATIPADCLHVSTRLIEQANAVIGWITYDVSTIRTDAEKAWTVEWRSCFVTGPGGYLRRWAVFRDGELSEELAVFGEEEHWVGSFVSQDQSTVVVAPQAWGAQGFTLGVGLVIIISYILLYIHC